MLRGGNARLACGRESKAKLRLEGAHVRNDEQVLLVRLGVRNPLQEPSERIGNQEGEYQLDWPITVSQLIVIGGGWGIDSLSSADEPTTPERA